MKSNCQCSWTSRNSVPLKTGALSGMEAPVWRWRLVLSSIALSVSCAADNGLSPHDVRLLVPVATGVPRSTLERHAQMGETVRYSDFDSKTLSVVLGFATGEPKEDFRPLVASGQIPPDPWISVSPQIVSWLTSDCLFDIAVENDGIRAKGSFRFRREGLFEGTVLFRAENRHGVWTLTRFELPLQGYYCELVDNDAWRSNLRVRN